MRTFFLSLLIVYISAQASMAQLQEKDLITKPFQALETASKNILQGEPNYSLLQEPYLNDLGYRYLAQDELDAAIQIFTLNTKLYPQSANTFDSLGEAFMKKGEWHQAILNYKLSLAINPENDHARVMLQVIDERNFRSLSLPEQTFESFWHFFEKNYAFFETRKILNWKERYTQYRPSIQENTSDKELYRTLRKMVQDFQDGHVNIETPKGDWSAMKQTPVLKEMMGLMKKKEIDEDEIIRWFFEVSDQTLASFQFSPVAYTESRDGAYPLFAFAKNDSIGYFRFSRCWLHDGIEQEKNLLRTLDSIFATFAEVHTLIVDVRMNQGGAWGRG